jgi:hypothetical protein
VTIPQHLRRYPCDEYFSSEWAEIGLRDEPSQSTLVLPASEIFELLEVSFLVVCSIGNNISLGYRANQPGFWSHLNKINHFTLVAPTLVEFIRRFYEGREGL